MTHHDPMTTACGPADRPEVDAALARWQAAELAAQLAAGHPEDVTEAVLLLAAAGQLVDVAAVLLGQVVATALEAAGGDQAAAVDVLRDRERQARQAVRAELAGALS